VPDIVAHDKIIHWGLSDRLLDIAENYLGVPVGYDGINVFVTQAYGPSSSSLALEMLTRILG
jgi:hypothetical protein